MAEGCPAGAAGQGVGGRRRVRARSSGTRTRSLTCCVQVVDDAGGVSVLLPASGSSSKSDAGQYINEAAVQETLGVRPDQVGGAGWLVAASY